MRLAGRINFFFDHTVQEIQSRVSIFIQQDGMELKHVFRMQGNNGVFL
jgi:hypothetical protein